MLSGVQAVVPVADTSKNSCPSDTSGGEILARNALPQLQCLLHSQGPTHPSLATKFVLSVCLCSLSHFMCFYSPAHTHKCMYPWSL